MDTIDLMSRVSLIIPALNEAECLSSLLADIPCGLVDQLIVVDNGSTDNTSAVARARGAKVIYEPRRGYGYACAAGAAAAQGNNLAFMDGDGSFLPGELRNLLVPIRAGEADLVLGSRLALTGKANGMPSHPHLGNWLFVRLLKMRFGLVITDLGP
ncbi:MAG: glycosyltransferase family 2 protein, partial [Acidobacteriaceae bacterium]